LEDHPPPNPSDSGIPFIPRWLDSARPVIGGVAAILPLYLVFVVYYGGSPQTLNIGYSPTQPVPFSHKLHAGELGMDCRYCHNTVDQAAHAAVPPTSTCMNCHERIAETSAKLVAVRESYATGNPVRWVRVHDLPDFVYFNHSAHVNSGVSCVSCHGRVDRMEVVKQVETLSMAWCLDCHRNPEPHLRPLDKVTDLAWDPLTEMSPEEAANMGAKVLKDLNVNPKDNCSTCHR